MKKILVASFAVAAFTFSYAQPPMPKGDNPPQEHQRGMRHHGEFGPHHGPNFKKLNLTDAQKQQMKTQNEGFKKQMQALNTQENITVKEQRAQRATIEKSRKAAFESILTPEQKNQLAQMKADGKKRMEEKGAQRLSKMKEKLNLTDAQYATIKANHEAGKAKIDAIIENDNLDRESKKIQLMAIKEELKKSTDAMLTPAQKAIFETMKSEKKHRMREFRHGNPGDRPDVK